MNRREELLRNKAKGLTITEAIHRTRANVECTEDELWHDWARRSTWAEEISRIQDGALVSEIVMATRNAQRESYDTYNTADNASARVGALRSYQRATMCLFEILKDMGIVKTEPLQINANLNYGAMPFELDPEIKAILIESARRQKAEKDGPIPQ
jgi:hypothetical protein